MSMTGDVRRSEELQAAIDANGLYRIRFDPGLPSWDYSFDGHELALGSEAYQSFMASGSQTNDFKEN